MTKLHLLDTVKMIEMMGLEYRVIDSKKTNAASPRVLVVKVPNSEHLVRIYHSGKHRWYNHNGPVSNGIELNDYLRSRCEEVSSS